MKVVDQQLREFAASARQERQAAEAALPGPVAEPSAALPKDTPFETELPYRPAEQRSVTAPFRSESEGDEPGLTHLAMNAMAPAGQGERSAIISRHIADDDLFHAASERLIVQNGVINDSPSDDPRVNAAAQRLGEILLQVDRGMPPGAGPIYGTAMHTAFARAVKQAGIPGIAPTDVESTLLEGDPRPYGFPGAARTGVVQRDPSGAIIAIFDLKTGTARLNAARREELRLKTGVPTNVPVFELRLER